jgi:hypothetical protein
MIFSIVIHYRLRNGDRGVFTVNTLFNSEAGLHESCIKLDLFCNKVIFNYIHVDLEKGCMLLNFITKHIMFRNKIVGTITALHPCY